MLFLAMGPRCSESCARSGLPCAHHGPETKQLIMDWLLGGPHFTPMNNLQICELDSFRRTLSAETVKKFPSASRHLFLSGANIVGMLNLSLFCSCQSAGDRQASTTQFTFAPPSCQGDFHRCFHGLHNLFTKCISYQKEHWWLLLLEKLDWYLCTHPLCDRKHGDGTCCRVVRLLCVCHLLCFFFFLKKIAFHFHVSDAQRRKWYWNDGSYD